MHTKNMKRLISTVFRVICMLTVVAAGITSILATSNGEPEPELKGTERLQGLESRDRLRELIDGKEIHLETMKDGQCTKMNDLMVQARFEKYNESSSLPLTVYAVPVD